MGLCTLCDRVVDAVIDSDGIILSIRVGLDVYPEIILDLKISDSCHFSDGQMFSHLVSI